MAARLRITNVLLATVLLTLVALVLMLATGARGGPLDPPAAPGSTAGVRLPGTPLTQPAPGGFPIVISQPGHYYLTSDITVTVGQVAIQISSHDVSLDLGGFMIRGDGSGMGIMVAPPAFQTPLRGITVSNGTLKDLTQGAVLTEAASARVKNLAVYAAEARGLGIGSDTVVEDCVVADSGEGITVEGSNSTIRECDLRNNKSTALTLYGGDGLVERSFFTGNARDPGVDYVVIVVGGSNALRGNTFRDRLDDVAEIQLLGQMNTVQDTGGCPFRVKDSGPAFNYYINNPCLTIVP